MHVILIGGGGTGSASALFCVFLLMFLFVVSYFKNIVILGRFLVTSVLAHSEECRGKIDSLMIPMHQTNQVYHRMYYSVLFYFQTFQIEYANLDIFHKPIRNHVFCGRYASRSLQSQQPCECNISLTSQVCFYGASDWSKWMSWDFHLFLKGDVT